MAGDALLALEEAIGFVENAVNPCLHICLPKQISHAQGWREVKNIPCSQVPLPQAPEARNT